MAFFIFIFFPRKEKIRKRREAKRRNVIYRDSDINEEEKEEGQGTYHTFAQIRREYLRRKTNARVT